MRNDGAAFAAYRSSLSKKPRYTVQISFDTAFADLAYFTSHSDSATPWGATVYESTITGIGGTSQKLDPLRANSSIGNLSLTLNDLDGTLTELFGTKLQAAKGLRGKRVRVYVGAEGDEWDDYILIATQIVYTIGYKDAAYSITCNDIQRSAKKDIFIAATTTLTVAIPGPGDSTYVDTGTTMPWGGTAVTISVADTTDFSTYAHGTSYTDGSASQTAGYIKIDDEIFAYTGKTATTFTGVHRHWLGTAAARHDIDTSASNARKTVVTEYVYLEMPALKLAYALLTGTLYNQAAELPADWHLDIDTAFIDDAAFVTSHVDLYNYADDTKGFIVRFAGEGRQDGKKFIEEQLMLPMAGFMPVLSTGELSFRRMARVLSNAGYVAVLYESNVCDYSELKHNFPDCINTVAIKWNWDHIAGKTTRTTALVDSDSVTTHGASPPKVLEYRGLYGNTHTDASIGQVFDSYIDRYSRPPLTINVKTHHALNHVEVGDIVRVRLDNVRDMTGDVATTVSLDRSFEVQGVSIDWITGETSFDLFGSSGAGVAIARTGNANDLDNTFYTSGLASNREINATNCGAAYSAGTLTSFAFTGNADATNSAAIWWHDGNLTLDGACTWTNNIQLRVKGTLTVNGTLNGTGAGCAGGAAITSGTANYFTAESGGGVQINFYDSNAYNGIFYSSPGLLTQAIGGKNTVENFGLVNDGGTLLNLPTDLRGSGGSGGGNIYYQASKSNRNLILGASGGTGGAGGGGIITIARAHVFNSNGRIITSGLPGSAGASFTFGASGIVLNGGGGAGGMPGVWLAIHDGNSVNVPDATDLVALSGFGGRHDNPLPSQPTNPQDISGGTYYSQFTPRSSESYSDDEPIGSSAFRFQRVPEDITPEEDTSPIAPIPTALAVVETANTPQTPAQNLAALTVTVTPPSAGNYSHSEIYYRVSASSDPYIYAGPAKDTYVITAAMDGTAYEVIAKPVSISGVESDESKRTTITTSNAKGGANLATGNWIASGQTAYDTGTGFYMVNESGTPKFSIGNSAGNKMTWNGTTLAITGTITATTGAIGGWSIGTTALTSGSGANSVGLDSGGSNPALYAGSATPGSAPFRVTQAGALTASSATITGAITATSGAVGGWTITGTTIVNAGGTITIDSSNNRIQLGSGASDYVRLTPTAIVGVSALLGTTFNLPTDGSAPTFASGIINSTVYNITSSGILRTSSTVGDGSANGYGVLINDTGVKGFQASDATPTFHLQTSDGSLTAKKGTVGGWTLGATAFTAGSGATTVGIDSAGTNPAFYAGSATPGSAPFRVTQAGALTATSGTVGGWTLGSTTLANGTDIILDASNKAISIKSATWQADGVQIQYNSGNPRAYIGDGSNKFFQFDGTDVSIGRDSKFLGADAYNNDNVYWAWDGDTYDNFYKSTVGSATNSLGTYSELVSTVTTGSSDYATMAKRAFTNFTTWDKSRRVKFYIWLTDTPGDQTTIEIGLGNAGGSGPKACFRLKPGSLALYGVSRSTVETELNLSTTLTANTYYKMEVVFTAATSAEFIVDDVSKGTISTNIPTGTTESENFIKWLVYNSGTSSNGVSLRVYAPKFLQDP